MTGYSPAAVTTALGVAGLPRHTSPVELPEAPSDWLIWRSSRPEPERDESEALPPPTLALPWDLDASQPLRRYLLVLADTLPANAEPLDAERAETLTVAPESAPSLLDLPDLEGVAASRVKWTPSSRQKTSRFKLSSRPWLQLHSAALCHGPERCHVDDQSDREWRHRRQSPTHTRCPGSGSPATGEAAGRCRTRSTRIGRGSALPSSHSPSHTRPRT